MAKVNQDIVVRVDEVIVILTVGLQGPPGRSGTGTSNVSGSVTRASNGVIQTVNRTGQMPLTISRQAGLISAISDGLHTTTFVRDGQGRIQSWEVT